MLGVRAVVPKFSRALPRQEIFKVQGYVSGDLFGRMVLKSAYKVCISSHFLKMQNALFG